MQHRVVAARPHHPPRIWLIAGLVGFAWILMLVFAATGNGAVIRHDRLLVGGPPLWLATLVFLAGWQVMLWAMMVPASIHAFGHQSDARTQWFFAAGYFTIWTGFGLLIFIFDAGVHATVNHWAWLASHPWLIAGATLVISGTYQLSDVKARSLAACRELLPNRRVRVTRNNALITDGIVHGVKCLGSSWGLMLLAFALGAGNLSVMGAITLFMVWEVTPWGASVVKVLGYWLIGLGVLVLAGPIQTPPWWPA